MNSSVISISEILNNFKSLKNTGFSSGYNFDEANAADYFDRLIENLIYPSPIFSGILILEKNEDGATIVDGIQRLTTISLLLCALCDFYKGTSTQNEESSNKILNRYLLNGNEPRLELTGEEKILYKKIVFSEEIEEHYKSNNLYKAYSTFLNKMNERKIAGNALYGILSKIQFMSVFVDNSEVSVRELYQTLNENKGMSQLNLITDFIAQKDESVMSLWQEMMDSYKDYMHLFEAFIKDFLITRKDGEAQNKAGLYNNFKYYYYTISKYKDTKAIIDDMFKYSKYYLKIINADFENMEIKEQITILNDIKAKDTYPYLMEVMDDLENSHIDNDAFLNILNMINRFINNRKENTISELEIDFSKLSKELNKMLILKDYIPESFEEHKVTINELSKI